MRYLRGPLWAAIFFLGSHGLACGQPLPGVGEMSFADMLHKAEELLIVEPHDPQLHFIRGMALAEMGRYLEAADEFRWMLTQDPSLLRPRLELARVLVLIGQHDSAKYNFEQVLANDIPETVRQNILNILANIREKTAMLTVSFAFVSDSNPNQATSAEEVEVGGVRYRLNSNSRASQTTGTRLAFDGRLPLAESSLWFVRANGEFNQYSEQRLNFQYLQGALGRNFQFQDRTLSIEAGGHAAVYGNDPLYDGAVLAVGDFHQLRPDVGIKFSAMAQQLNYRDYPHLSGWQYGATVQGVYAPSSISRWEVAAGVLRNEAKEAPYSFLQYQLSGRYIREWVGGWITGIGLHGSVADYDDTDPVFLKKRLGTETKLEFELSNRRLRIWKFTPQLQFGWIDRHSNIDFYSYSRAYARIGMSGDF